MSLRRALYGVVEMRIVIDVSPKGHLLGVDILETSKEYMVVRVTKILPFAKDLIVILMQHDCLVLTNIVSKMVLYRVQDVDLPLEDPLMSTVGIEVEVELFEDLFASLEN